MRSVAVKSTRAVGRLSPSRNRRLVKEILFYLAVALILVVVLVPFLWMVSGSFKTTLELQSADVMRPGQEPRFIPREPTLENYIRVNSTVPMLDYFWNSIIISTGTMVVATLLALLAGYAISRFDFPGRRPYVISVFSTQMLPGILFLIPYFVVFTWIHQNFGVRLRDTYAGMIFTYTSFSLPFAMMMLSSYIDTIPREIDEQARIDGCSSLGILFRMILPLSMPSIAAVGIYSFIMAWNEILFASVLTGTHTKTVAIGLLDFITAQEARWGGMMAASVIVSVPVVFLFTLVQRQIIDGLVSGATKG